MPWVDLAVMCAVIWGAIYGWFQGTLRMLLKVLLLCVAVIAANYYKGILTAYLVNETSVVAALNRSISQQLILPVDVIYGFSAFPVEERLVVLSQYIRLPKPFQEDLLEYLVQTEIPAIVEGLLNEGQVMSEILAHLMINVASFVLSLAVISAILYILSEVLLHRCRIKLLHQTDRLGGMLLGAVRSFLLLTLIIGVATGLFFPHTPRFLITEMNNSKLVSCSMELFIRLGGWW